MPTILLKKSDTPGSVPGTANLTNLAGGVEVAVNTADKRMFSMTSASAVIELGTNPSSLTCADASFTVARITSLTISSLSLTNATFASATITNLTSTSATISSALTLSGGTANGVLYLNGSKVATSGTAFTFSGTAFSVGDGSTQSVQNINGGATGGAIKGQRAGVNQWFLGDTAAALGSGTGLINFLYGADPFIWYASSAELMRLTTTGLGIGTSSPGFKLDVNAGASPAAAQFQSSSSTYADFLNGTITGRIQTISSDFFIGTATAGASLAFKTGNNTERMRLDSSGNLGIGTSSPSYRLHVVGGATVANRTTSDTPGDISLGVLSTASVATFGWRTDTSNNLHFDIWNGASWSAALTTSLAGNLGLGVTPSASSVKTFEVGAVGNTLTGFGLGDVALMSNVYYDGAFKYAGSNLATRYRQQDGTHAWSVAASGTAGNAISFTQAMTLDASGNLGLGVTPSASTIAQFEGGSNLILVGRGNVYASNNATFNSGWKYISTAAAAQYNISGAEHRWFNAASGTAGNAITFTQAMTLDASGNLGVGITSPGARLDVVGGTGIRVNEDGSSTKVIQVRSNFAGVGPAINVATNDPLLFQTNNTERARITAGGEVYIAGTTDQGAYNLQVNGTGVWGAGAYVNGSDARLKDNIQSLDSGLDVVKAIRPVTFQYKPEYSKDQSVQPGFIAQELQEAMADKPYLEGVVQAGPNHLNVAYQNIIPILVKAIQELEAKVAALEAK